MGAVGVFGVGVMLEAVVRVGIVWVRLFLGGCGGLEYRG